MFLCEMLLDFAVLTRYAQNHRFGVWNSPQSALDVSTNTALARGLRKNSLAQRAAI
jgi:hypothetical protein